jgi:hypothetical protein
MKIFTIINSLASAAKCNGVQRKPENREPIGRFERDFGGDQCQEGWHAPGNGCEMKWQTKNESGTLSKGGKHCHCFG